MANQVPRGPEDLMCPKWLSPMSEVCHKCPLWMSIPIRDPETNEFIRDWKCALVWGPLLQFQTLKETFSVGKEVNELRNETQKAHNETTTMAAIAVQRSADAVREATTAKEVRNYIDRLAEPSTPVALIENGGTQ
jgi:hypothetical protein